MAPVLSSLLFFLFLLPCFSFAQLEGNVRVGEVLTAADDNSSWLSASGDFAFGFRQLNVNKDLFFLAIWFDKIPDRTIVWYANGDKPAPKGSRVELTADRGLVLNDPYSELIWRSNFTSGVVANGVMNDTGNFVLESSSSVRLWESFNYPTDTLLPTQILESVEVLSSMKLSSRRSETNFSRGRFQFRLLGDGNLVLNLISLENLVSNYAYEAYYHSDTVDVANTTIAGKQVVFDESGYIYVMRGNNERVNVTRADIGTSTNYYQRATLHFDGLFIQYYHPKTFTGSGGWSIAQSIPDNICIAVGLETGLGSGACGYNSICNLTANNRPNCYCPPGFSLLDPSDAYGSCKPDFVQGCEEDGLRSGEDLYHVEELRSIDWPTSDYERVESYSMEQCNSSCLQDCLCAAAIFRNGTCWKKKLPLSNGRFNGDDIATALIKIRKDSAKTWKVKDILFLVGSVVLGSSVFINFILVPAICLGFLIINQKKLQNPGQDDGISNMNLRCFKYKELEDATNGFKEELGRGSFGTVYKGIVEMGSRRLVAVKKLARVVQDGEKEFKAEVNVIGETHHKNLIRLLGFCNERQNRLLVYELLSNGTLASFLFRDLKPSWNQRTQIAIGVARGLLYLHEECSTQIIHCDIKPQNILLDDDYNARISDFGLAKLLMMDQSQTCTVIRGTKGYVAPEWFRNMPITAKVDVYSFGVLLLEIICCRRSVGRENDQEEKAILTDWAYDCYREGTLSALVEDDLEALKDMKNLERFVMVAIWCIQEEPSLRPTMRKITQMLEGVVEVTVPPCPCLFSIVSSN